MFQKEIKNRNNRLKDEELDKKNVDFLHRL